MLFLDPGSEIRDPEWVNIPDPQHCRELSHSLLQEFQRVHEELGQFADLQRHLAGLRLPAQLAELRFSALVNPFPQAVCFFMNRSRPLCIRGGGGRANTSEEGRLWRFMCQRKAGVQFLFYCIFFGGLECVGYSFAYVTHFVFL